MRSRAHTLEHNCSGKHAAMLLLCRVNGLADRGLPAVRRTRASRRCSPRSQLRPRSSPTSMPTAVDGCGVVTYALTLERMAHAFSRLESLDGGSRAADAMRAHPELIRGDGRAGHRAHAARRRLGREGRRRGAPLRRAGRPRHRAQGRGRRPAAAPERARRVPDPARLRRGRSRDRSGRELARRGRRRAPRHRTGTAR